MTLSTMGQSGLAIMADVLSGDEVATLIEAIAETNPVDASQEQRGRYAMRNLLSAIPAVRKIAGSSAIRAIAEGVLGDGAFVARSLLFDKTASANWNVAWHQDLLITVRERREVAGYGPWSMKAGVPHVQPPVKVLEKMVTLRLHLDDCGEDNGPLRVLPGSHRAGILSGEQIDTWRDGNEPVTCLVPRGGVLVMRPLLLHASSAAKRPGHRRVVHLEFASGELDGGLQWHTAR